MVNELQVSSLKFHDFYLIVQIHPLLMVGGFIVVSSEGQPILILKKPENNCDIFSSYILNSILKLVVEQYRHMMHLEFFLRFFFWSAEVDFLSGLCCVESAAILVFKSVGGTKRFKKAVHLNLQGVAILTGFLGILAALKFHLDKGIPNFYSLHSWLGILTFVLYSFQVLSLYCEHLSLQSETLRCGFD